MAVTVNILNRAGEPAGALQVSDKLLGVEPNPAVMRQALDAYLSNQRLGTHAVKSRANVSGSDAKPWRQKGTGRARAGTRKSPLWRGGGICFGPQPHKFTQKLNRKMRTHALTAALSEIQRAGKLFAVEEIAVDAPKTAQMAQFLDKIGAGTRKVLLIIDPGRRDEKGEFGDQTRRIFLSARNLPQVTTAVCGSLNVHDLLRHETVVITKQALSRLQELYK